MTTKQVKARKVTTADRLVVQGKLRREALSICEVHRLDGHVHIVARHGSTFERHHFGANDLVRVEG